MPGRFDPADSHDAGWEAEDPDAPQERDLTDDEEDETPTVPCPHCRREVPDFADRCPYCGEWIVQSSGAPAGRSAWFILIVLIAVLLILAIWIL
jgi:DNA-directed RNA polymerase subunit RPC12/RpoP